MLATTSTTPSSRTWLAARRRASRSSRGCARGRHGHHLAPVPLQHRLQRRGRPPFAYLRAPHVAVLQLLRPRAVRPADQPRQQRHPQRPDVLDLRSAHHRAVLHRRRRVRLHARASTGRWRSDLHDRDADPLRRRHQDAPRHVPDLVDHPGAPRRSRDHRRRERERRSRRQVLRPGRGRDQPARRRRRRRRLGVHQGRQHPRGVVTLGPEPAPARPRTGAVLRRLDGPPRRPSVSPDPRRSACTS